MKCELACVRRHSARHSFVCPREATHEITYGDGVIDRAITRQCCSLHARSVAKKRQSNQIGHITITRKAS